MNDIYVILAGLFVGFCVGVTGVNVVYTVILILFLLGVNFLGKLVSS